MASVFLKGQLKAYESVNFKFYLSVGNKGFPMKYHSYSGSGNPVTKAVNLAAMPKITERKP